MDTVNTVNYQILQCHYHKKRNYAQKSRAIACVAASVYNVLCSRFSAHALFGGDILSGTALKLIALLLMIADHIGQFIPGTPLLLRWIGRLSAPLFLFCTLHGFSHTRSRTVYLQRLYIFALITALAELCCTLLCPYPAVRFTSNIFITLFCICFTLSLAEATENRLRNLILFMLWQFAAAIICFLSDGLAAYGLIAALTASIFACEGGIFFVGMGLCLYYVKDEPKKLAAMYLFISFLQFSAALLTGGMLRNFQWMMVFALPFMLLYNGRRGAGLKYLFYVIYPVHLVLLYLIGAGMQ